MFIMWLEEWKAEAEKRGLNSKWTYVKAISSIKKYPLPLRSGKECKILENIGDGIAKKLDERLQQYLENGGDPSLLHKVSVSAGSSKSKVSNSRGKAKAHELPNAGTCNEDKSKREYVCKYRSGPYALIVTLYNDKRDPSSVGHMVKEDLIKKAQPLCDKSLTVADGGSHYTAWSSMGTLIKKGYVVKRSNPAQYLITDFGCELARRLLQGTGELRESASTSDESSVVCREKSEDGIKSDHVETSVAQTTNEVAEVETVNLLARIRRNGYQTKGVSEIVTKTADNSNNGPLPSNSGDGKSIFDGCAMKENVPEVNNSPKYSPSPVSRKRSPTPLLINNHKAKSPRMSAPSENECETQRTTVSIQKDSLTSSPLFTLAPGSFDVVLCVDTSETAGAGKHKKDLLSTLYNSNIHVESRKLQLGDFLWIAKEKGGIGRELVLDTIIERKRIDDLAGSIVDGRFREQKFRLKNCSLKNPIYLVEKYGSTEHLPVPEATLRQAITNTQVIDRFFVKETSDIYDSANYLTLLTSQLNSLYKNKTLHGLPMDQVAKLKEGKPHAEVLQDADQYLISYEEFSTQTQKNKILTVSEMFAKLLMQVKGITAEKALAITDKYPTPTCLLKSYGGCSGDEDKLLSNIVFGGSKRKVGDALSKQVHIMFSRSSVDN